ncbi:MAG: hypothetical protein ACLPVY_21650 [Acidimicrobiia bacterium]
MQPNDAVDALAEIRQRQRQVINAVRIPLWYWCLVAGSMIGLSAAVDSHRAVAVGLGVTLFVLVVAGASAWLVFGWYRGARVHRDLLGSAAAVSIVAFVWLLVGGTLALAFGLRAAHVTHPATIASGGAALAILAGGPALNRRLRRTMLDHGTSD